MLSSGSDFGIRIYARERDWAEIARDMKYVDQIEAAAFGPDGRLATTGHDGRVRLYGSDLEGDIRPVVAITALTGRPSAIAFSPDGSWLAIGYENTAAVTLLDGHTLAPLPAPDLSGIAIDNDAQPLLYPYLRALSRVAWSRDGATLFAAGTYHPAGSYAPPVVAWSNAGAGARRMLPAGENTVTTLVPLSEDDLLVATADPWLGRLQADGSARWAHGPPQTSFSNLDTKLAVSNDGTLIDFNFVDDPKARARFDLSARTLTLNPEPDQKTNEERVLSILAQHPDGDRFVLAGRLNNALMAVRGWGEIWGKLNSLTPEIIEQNILWIRKTVGDVWSVNITGDGRLVVAAYHDGTIRWHRMSDGVELLAFMPMPDRTNWVAWTPEGFYAATGGAHGALRWHVNHGWDAPADSVPVSEIPGSFRPVVLPLVLQELETPRALGLAVLAEHNREVKLRTHSQMPPGAQLHLLTIGISEYNEAYAKNLRLNYADRDARDLANAILSTQASLYSRVIPQVLSDKDASKAGILRALKTMRAGMEANRDNDLAVVHFSGHGALVDGKLYLLPYEVDARDAVGIQTNGLSIDELRGELLELAKHGRVLVLLDACHSGATTMSGTPLAMDLTALRTGLAAAKVTVLTSSSGNELSREDAKWEHGAFTKVLLDALTDPGADPDRNGLIKPTALAHYVDTHVKTMTDGAQSPGMEVRFDTTVFATGL